ncbi:MAG: DUF192 domain-containing protein [Opitutales bacterium]
MKLQPPLSNRLILFSVTLCLLLTACHPESEQNNVTAGPTTYFPIRIGAQLAHLQLALNDAERSKGLMFRDQLKSHHGMLFIFERPAQRHFWMRNTRIPLDLGYFDSFGKLKEIHKLYPYDETSVASRSRQIQIVIEMNQGWYSQQGVLTGAQIDLQALSQAIRSRGFDPSDFQL